MQVAVRKYKAGSVSPASNSPLRLIEYPVQKTAEKFGKVKFVSFNRHSIPANDGKVSSREFSFLHWCMPPQPEKYIKHRRYDFY